jgi:hypothetical protein
VLSGIKLDKTIPVGSITINNEAIYTNSTSVTLHLNATDALSGIYGVRLSNDGIWDIEPWESVLSTRSWTLTSGDGNKTVYFQARDNAGLVSATYSAEITLDTVPPNITQVYQTPIANVMPENEVRIDAVILDANGIKLAVLNYTTGNGIWTLVDMTFTGKSVWNASVPAFPYGTTVTYAIITEDTAGNHITTDELGEHLQYDVIPELPSPILLLVFVIGTLLVVLLHRARAHCQSTPPHTSKIFNTGREQLLPCSEGDGESGTNHDSMVSDYLAGRIRNWIQFHLSHLSASDSDPSEWAKRDK